MLNAETFIEFLQQSLSPLVHAEHTVYARFEPGGFTSWPRTGSVYVVLNP